MSANTDHDEAYNRATWQPTEDCLGGGLETTRAPRYTPARTLRFDTVEVGGVQVRLPRGTITGGTKIAKTNGRRTYR